jgi:phage baseplate assembly protein gpV
MRVFLLIVITVVLAGCATEYTATRTDPDTGVTTSITVKSYREFPGGVSIKYDREAGAFEIVAGEVSTGSSPLEEAAAALLLQMPGMVKQ